MVEEFSKDFSARLSRYRLAKGVSAREMSLSLGQNPGYINMIESGKALPSMLSFHYICEYLGISPTQFFEEDGLEAQRISGITRLAVKLTDEQIGHVAALLADIVKPEEN